MIRLDFKARRFSFLHFVGAERIISALVSTATLVDLRTQCASSAHLRTMCLSSHVTRFQHVSISHTYKQPGTNFDVVFFL